MLLAEYGALASREALVLGGACALLGLAGRSAAWMAACSLGLFVAVGGHGLATRLELADRGRSSPSTVAHRYAAAVEAWVCAVDGRSQWVAVELCDVVPVGFGLREAEPAGEGLLPARLRLVESRGSPGGDVLVALAYGEALRARVRIRPAHWLSNPGRSDPGRRLARRGIGVRAGLADPALVVRLPDRGRGSRLAALLRLRERIGERLHHAGPGGALLRALATGDRASLSPESAEQFTQLGIGHLLAVSGLHLGLTAGAGYGLLLVLLVRIPRLAARWDVRPIALLSALALVFFYALLAGWGVSVRRALVFVAVAVTKFAARRAAAGPHALAAASIVVLTWEPGALFAPGAQLSFVATAALLFAVRPAPSVVVFESRGRRVLRWLASGLRVSATAIAATSPMIAWHGMHVGSVGLLANAFAVPWTAGVLLPAAQLGALVAALPLGEAIAAPLLGAAEYAARLTLVAVEAASRHSNEVESRAFAPWAIATACLMAGLALAARSTGVRVALGVLIPIVLRLAPAPTLGPEAPRLVAFDVGQGDAVLVEGRRGAMLVDGGWALPDGPDLGRTVLLPGLRALGVEQLDVVVATHADLDHRGGLAAVLDELPVRELWLPSGGLRDPDFDELVALAREHRVRVRERFVGDGEFAADDPSILGDIRATPLWPPAIGRSPEELPALATRNDRSLVLLVELAGQRVLLTGDIGRTAEKALLEHAQSTGEDVGADVLKIAHHGSRGSSSTPFLTAIGADVAIVSAPCVSRAGLPTREALSRARRAGLAVWWTGRDGAVLVSLSEDGPVRVWGNESEDRCKVP